MTNLYKGIKMKKNVTKTTNGVNISFTGEVKKQNIVEMVQNCAAGQCDCMSDQTKEKITNMQVSGVDGNVKLDLSGSISKEEIETALAQSKVLGDSCC